MLENLEKSLVKGFESALSTDLEGNRNLKRSKAVTQCLSASGADVATRITLSRVSQNVYCHSASNMHTLYSKLSLDLGGMGVKADACHMHGGRGQRVHHKIELTATIRSGFPKQDEQIQNISK